MKYLDEMKLEKLKVIGARDRNIDWYTRNKIALISSTNLRDWEIKKIVLEHPYTGHHGFQYVDFQFEEDDIIAASRTGWTGSNSTHDANYFIS